MPATCLSYNDVPAYCEWAAVRLPTEAEWIAASLVDLRVYTRKEFDAEFLGPDGRYHHAMDHPDSLEYLNAEFVGHDAEHPVVRLGPFYLRFADWRDVQFRYVCDSPYGGDLMTGFRIVRCA